MHHAPFRLVLAFALGGAATGCVVSTYDPPGTPPDVALAAEPETKAPPRPGGPSEVGASHILISYRGAMRAAPTVKRTKVEARRFAEGLLERAVAGESFALLARENSDDRGSAPGGGELGRFRRDQMVPAFSDAVFALQVNQLSRVVESPYGFHVILRTE